MGSLPERVTPRRHAIRKGVTCRELVELITNYLEDEMPPDERTRFEQHLGYCESCVIYLSQIRRTVDIVGSLREEHLTADARDELIAAFRGWPNEP